MAEEQGEEGEREREGDGDVEGEGEAVEGEQEAATAGAAASRLRQRDCAPGCVLILSCALLCCLAGWILTPAVYLCALFLLWRFARCDRLWKFDLGSQSVRNVVPEQTVERRVGRSYLGGPVVVRYKQRRRASHPRAPPALRVSDAELALMCEAFSMFRGSWVVLKEGKDRKTGSRVEYSKACVRRRRHCVCRAGDVAEVLASPVVDSRRKHQRAPYERRIYTRPLDADASDWCVAYALERASRQAAVVAISDGLPDVCDASVVVSVSPRPVASTPLPRSLLFSGDKSASLRVEKRFRNRWRRAGYARTTVKGNAAGALDPRMKLDRMNLGSASSFSPFALIS